MPEDNGIFRDDELITTTISPRKITYYLVTQSEMSNLENNSYIQDLLLFISSIFGAIFLGLYLTSFSDLTKLTSEQLRMLYTWKIIALIFFIVSFLGSIVFFFIRRNNMKKLQSNSIKK